MTLAGRLDVEIDAARADDPVRVASTRPLGLSATFAGRRPGDVVGLVPLVFSVCGMAQGVAAARACERALAMTASASAERARDLLVLAETAREHLLRIAVDWPPFARLAADAAALKRIMALDKQLGTALGARDGTLAVGSAASPDLARVAPLAGALAALIADIATGEPTDAWLDRDDAVGWSAAADTPAAALLHRLAREPALDAGARPLAALPPLGDGVIAAALLGDDGERLIAAPTWDGPRETTPLARQHAHALVAGLASGDGYGLGARIAARLVELARVPAQMLALIDGAASAAADAVLPAGVGAAQVEAARGRLIHAVAVDSGLIVRYRILAPTEWNFHPGGAAVASLAAIAAGGHPDTDGLARLAVTAFDPCVACNVEVR